jgi:uncharacterized glyoxalase superfamily protein PhnB
MVAKDLARTLDFYRTLGLAIPEGEEGLHVELELPGGFVLGIDAEAMVRQVDPDWREPQGGERLSLQFKVDSPAEVDMVYDRLIAWGAESYKEPWDAFWGQRFARVRDPDDNVIGIFAPLGED